MESPGDQTWRRVEILADEIAERPAAEGPAKLRELAAAGEPQTVLTLLRAWLALPPPAAPADVGAVIGGRYRLRRKLGEGGMGSVWLAHQLAVDRDVALKMIHPALITPMLQRRFQEEIQLLGKLDHPGIVRIIDAGLHEDARYAAPIPYFTMEYIQGDRLDFWAGRHRNDRCAQLQLMASVCAALQSAHDRGIVHRDLKPANILVKDDDQPVVLDFGIARLAGFTEESSNVFSGTPQYAAPEQHLGRDRDFRSGESVDVYAVGAILFEMLAGRRLFQFTAGVRLAEIRRAILEDPVPRLQTTVPDCPQIVDEIVARAVRRDPADRFYSMAGLGRALGAAAATLNLASPPPPEWSPAPLELVPGTRWRLDSKIGEGSVGQIWLASHEELKTRRVFKFCATAERARTLNRELTLFRLLKERIGLNPHFIQLHDVSLDDPPWYLMMEHVDAQDLESWAAAQPGGLSNLSLETRIEIVAQAAEALQAAHEAGILHRDIKPGNLLVRTAAALSSPHTAEHPGEIAPVGSAEFASAPGSIPARLHVFIADFGIGQIVATEILSSGTHLGFTRTLSSVQRAELSGTMLYMAPEILAGSDATARSDIYSLGVLLWQILIGNFQTALDPADWSSRIENPFLRQDLTRCLAGIPGKRWASAGELAASLRNLGNRKAAEERRLAEIAARERVAYRRGVTRTALVAAGIIGALVVLGGIALHQRRAVEKARGQIALEQASGLSRTDFDIGRRQRGMALVDTAAATVADRPSLRSAEAAVMGMWDLMKVRTNRVDAGAVTAPTVRELPGESCRTLSPDGTILAVARDLDGVNGVVELLNPNTGQLKVKIERQHFPWVPVAEPGMLQFSFDSRRLAIGGAATSRHLLLCNTANGSAEAYFYHGSDALSCGWHPSGRLIVTGCADGTIRVWETTVAASAMKGAASDSQFDLPPALSVPALNLPAQILRGHRGPVLHLAFSPQGRWLASLDGLGYLRIHTGFTSQGLAQLPSADYATGTGSESGPSDLNLVIETRLADAERVSGLRATEHGLIVQFSDRSSLEYEMLASHMPWTLHVASGLGDIAWNSSADQLCAITATDIHWLSGSPFEVLDRLIGHNPVGIAWDPRKQSWLVPKDKQLFEYRSTSDEGKVRFESQPVLALSEAVPGQGARTALTMCGDGRSAVYRGRRIHFFADGNSAALNSSLIASEGGILQDLGWDTPGKLLGASFRLPNGKTLLESWSTSAAFPPVCSANPPVQIQCRRIIPANDGRHFIARGKQQGLLWIDPASKENICLDHSDFACQTAPLAASFNGSLLAMVVDGNALRLLSLPDGRHFADLRSSCQSSIITLAWDTTGQNLAGVTEDGHVLIWELAPWQKWLEQHDLQSRTLAKEH